MRYVFAKSTYCPFAIKVVSKVAAADVGVRVRIKKTITRVCSGLFCLVRSEELGARSEERVAQTKMAMNDIRAFSPEWQVLPLVAEWQAQSKIAEWQRMAKENCHRMSLSERSERMPLNAIKCHIKENK